MKRISLFFGVLAIGAALPAGLAGASPGHATLKLRKTSVGTILVNGSGFTLYAFTKDSRNKDVCMSISSCTGVWPVLRTGGKPVADPGVKASLIGTITVKGGAKQVTYAGHPLYTYSGDSSPGETFYVNASQFGGNWPALNAAGHEVK